MIEDILLEAEDKMDKATQFAKEELATIRTGRATPQMFSKILVDYYGTPTPLNQVAGFSAPEPRMALISPFDPSSMNAVEKAIRDSDLGVNPANDGHVLRIVLPQLTEERRREMIKLAHTKAEEAKVSIRNVRRHAKAEIEKLDKAGEIGEDDARRGEKELDDLTGKYVAGIDKVLEQKEQELLEV